MSVNTNRNISALVHGTVLTMDGEWTCHDDGMVLADGDTISAVGPYSAEPLKDIPAEQILDVRGCIVIPGLINTHTHIGMSLFRGLADDTADRLRRIIFPLEKEFVTPELVYLASLHSLAEMILGGTTCFADMYFFQNMTAKAVGESGIRAVVGQAVSRDPAPDAPSADHAFDLIRQLALSLKGNPRLRAGIAPHAPYSLTREELEECSRLSEELELPLMSHLAEMPFEEGWVKEHHNMRPVQYYHSCGMLNSRSTMAHCIFAGEEDQKLLVQSKTGIAHNPSANSKSGKGIAPAYDLLMKGGRVGLGTDGPMSGNTLDLVHQLNIAAKMQKLIKRDPTVMNPRQTLRCATMGGAEALHMEHEIGSLEPGKKADITVFSTASPAMYPLYDPYAALVYAAAPSDVYAVIVGGRLLMEDRKLLSLDDREIRKTSAEMVEHIRREMTGK
ncbi:amidohydrolase [Treponema sp. OttesenSCG-928-L16]|nr:amidohydrolase [Treponema sp. OttesenSCG-928-L16]